MIVLLMLLAAGVVRATGGTAYAYPYLMLAPVLVGAYWYALAGGLGVALAAGLLMALMPQDAALGIEQSLANVMIRLALYLLLGGVSGWLFLLRRRSAAQHRIIARTDPLSGLANQVALNEDLRRRLPPAGHQGRHTGLMLVRLTDLTDVIDALGLDAANELVLMLGERLERVVRGAPTAYRIHHDELALILEDVTPEDLARVAERLMAAGEESLPIHQVPVRVQLAMGSSIAQRAQAQASELLREARIALFTALRQRQGYRHFAEHLERHSRESLQLIARVRSALDRREFRLHYQPKIRLADGRVCGGEGLIRWQAADGQLISPGQFMPKVESTSLIYPVTHFVAREAGAFVQTCAGEGVISINLSVYNLYDEEFITLLRELVAQDGVAAERLEVEITETALIGDLEAARQAIQRIRDLGIGVSIDDFGTGYASFEYLQHLPLTGLKIDRSFVAHLEETPTTRKLMACMIDMGHALDLVVTAEGVETQGQADILRELGCDQAQGFFYARPLPAADYHAWCLANDAS
ncbi:phosphodiesterase [Halomonas sp. YLGW01]|uniref:putative bifunctional diguanylate cyclase/phosphodiesterase n=1 Tax=Halomonas sp. YLGW01 TaxID=2773308 RepID=UPI00177AC909|nr:phosphodiesterase [Halomonas sp. YLGW01]